MLYLRVSGLSGRLVCTLSGVMHWILKFQVGSYTNLPSTSGRGFPNLRPMKVCFWILADVIVTIVVKLLGCAPRQDVCSRHMYVILTLI